MTATLIVSSQFIDATHAEMWSGEDATYVMAHPDWFDRWNASPPPPAKPFDNVINLDLSANAKLRDTVFDSWRAWRAG